MVRFDFNTYVKQFVSDAEIRNYDTKIADVKNYFHPNSNMMGWCDLNSLSNVSLVDDIINTADYIKNNCDVLLVIGIGGSYLGSLAVIESLSPYFYNKTKKPEIYFLGTSLSSDYYLDLMDMIKDKNIIVNVISKSGTTLETIITYNLVMEFMKEKYNTADLKNRIIITTDSETGVLRNEVNELGCKSFVMPNNIGGRYSVLSPVGLLPIAACGIDIVELLKGAKGALNEFDAIFKYAVIKDIMFNKNKTVEAYVCYEPKLGALLEWLKQLTGESLGKDGKGLLPVSFINTRDLHSLGQFIQDGNNILFETVINVEKASREITIDKYKKNLSEINLIASNATSIAHQKGEVLNNIITIDELNAYNIGYLLQFFMLTTAASGCLMGINPFDQNGVEEYKNVMRNFL